MSKWQFIKLSDIFELQMGKTPSRDCKNYWDNGIYNWVSIADIGKTTKYIYETKEKITENAVSESGIKLVPKGTIIMSFKLSLGKTCITGKDIYTNEAIMAFLDKHIYSIDKNYIYHLFSNYNWGQNTNKAVKGITLNKATLSKIKIPLPPLEEQHKIASILDTVSETLKLRKQQLNELDLLVKSKFIDMFGDPIENPMKWTNKYLNEVYEIIDGDRGVNYPKSNEFFEDGYCLFLNTGNVTKSGFCFEKTQFISEFKDSMLRKGKLQRYDIVLTTRGTVGNLAYYDEKIKFENIRINSGMVILRRKLECNPTFFINYFNISLSYINFMSGTAQPQMPIYLMRKLKVIYPPIELQNKFASFVQHVDKLKSEVQKSIDQLQTLFDSLMQQYFE